MTPIRPARQKFSLGRVVITGTAQGVIPGDEAAAALRRHAAGDRGDLCVEDRAVNEQALRDGQRLLSSYRSASGVPFWIITDADRAYTTILRPEDY